MLTEGTNIGEMHSSSRLLDTIGIAYIFKDFSNLMKQISVGGHKTFTVFFLLLKLPSCPVTSEGNKCDRNLVAEKALGYLKLDSQHAFDFKAKL